MFKRKQYVYQWLGILICVCGVGIVGLASVHDTPASGSVSKSIIGGVLVILGMFSASVRGRCAVVWCFGASESTCLMRTPALLAAVAPQIQMVVEEKYLKGRNLPPEFVVGAEGAFGIIVMTWVVLPIVAFVPGEGSSIIVVCERLMIMME